MIMHRFRKVFCNSKCRKRLYSLRWDARFGYPQEEIRTSIQRKSKRNPRRLWTDRCANVHPTSPFLSFETAGCWSASKTGCRHSLLLAASSQTLKASKSRIHKYLSQRLLHLGTELILSSMSCLTNCMKYTSPMIVASHHVARELVPTTAAYLIIAGLTTLTPFSRRHRCHRRRAVVVAVDPRRRRSSSSSSST